MGILQERIMFCERPKIDSIRVPLNNGNSIKVANYQ